MMGTGSSTCLPAGRQVQDRLRFAQSDTSGRVLLLVNPGSPTFPNHQSLRLGTIGYLDIEDGRVTPPIVQLR